MINNHQNELSNNDEDYVYSNDTSFTVDDNNYYYRNVDYDPRYDRQMSHSKLSEGLSKQNLQKWFNYLKRSSEWKNELDDGRNVATPSTQKMSESDDNRSSEIVPSSSTSSEIKNLSKNLIP